LHGAIGTPGEPGGGVHGADQGRGRIPSRISTARGEPGGPSSRVSTALREYAGSSPRVGTANGGREMSVITPYRSEVRAGRDGFAQILRAEWTKFRTVRGWVVGTVIGALLIVGLGALTGANSHCSYVPVTAQNPTAAVPCPAPPTGPDGQ